MKLYILADLEGVCGVVHPDQTIVAGPRYEKAREWLTMEINAAVQGAIDGGATEILVLDGHGICNACNLIPENLHEGARYIQGAPWLEYPQSLDSSFDGIFQVGAHAMAGTKGAILEHTMSSGSWVEMRINGVPTGEIGLISAIAGASGVPFLMVSGDDKACAEAAAIVPDVECAVVKEGITRHSANNLALPVAHRLIREKAEAAARKAGKVSPFIVDSPTEVEIFYLRTNYVDGITEREGVRKVDARRVAYSGKDILHAYKRVLGGA